MLSCEDGWHPHAWQGLRPSARRGFGHDGPGLLHHGGADTDTQPVPHLNVHSYRDADPTADADAGSHGRGLSHYNEDRIELALKDFDKAIELKPGFAAAFRNRGVLYLNSGELEKAAADLETAVALFEEINDFRSASESRALLRQARP